MKITKQLIDKFQDHRSIYFYQGEENNQIISAIQANGKIIDEIQNMWDKDQESFQPGEKKDYVVGQLLKWYEEADEADKANNNVFGGSYKALKTAIRMSLGKRGITEDQIDKFMELRAIKGIENEISEIDEFGKFKLTELGNQIYAPIKQKKEEEAKIEKESNNIVTYRVNEAIDTGYDHDSYFNNRVLPESMRIDYVNNAIHETRDFMRNGAGRTFKDYPDNILNLDPMQQKKYDLLHVYASAVKYQNSKKWYQKLFHPINTRKMNNAINGLKQTLKNEMDLTDAQIEGAAKLFNDPVYRANVDEISKDGTAKQNDNIDIVPVNNIRVPNLEEATNDNLVINTERTKSVQKNQEVLLGDSKNTNIEPLIKE